MSLRTAAARRHAGALLPLCVLALALVGCSRDQYPQTALLPLSDFARIGDHIQDQTFYWALGVFVLVEGALIYAIFRFRGRPDDPEPSQIHGNTTIEIIWTLIPALILAVIAVPTVKGIFETNKTPENALKIEVIGHQWWWEFRYPDDGVVVQQTPPDYDDLDPPTLVLPVGAKVVIHLSSTDVVHSFSAPNTLYKLQAIPGNINTMHLEFNETGVFTGQCYQFCGVRHSDMLFIIDVREQADYEAWLSETQAAQGVDPAKLASASED